MQSRVLLFLLAIISLVGCEGPNHPVAPTAPSPSGIEKAIILVHYAVAYVASIRATDLGTLAGNVSSVAYDVNDTGQVVGVSTDGSGTPHAVLWPSGGSATSLGTLGGSGSVAHSINASGVVAGWSDLSGDTSIALFRWNGTMTALLPPTPSDLGFPISIDAGFVQINDAGMVVGTASSPAFPFGVYWSPGSTAGQVVTGLVGPSTGTDVNNSNEIVGHDYGGGDACYSWLGGTVTDFGIPSVACYPYGVNDNGWITGYGYFVATAPFVKTHAFRYDGDSLVDLGTLAPTDTAAL